MWAIEGIFGNGHHLPISGQGCFLGRAMGGRGGLRGGTRQRVGEEAAGSRSGRDGSAVAGTAVFAAPDCRRATIVLECPDTKGSRNGDSPRQWRRVGDDMMAATSPAGEVGRPVLKGQLEDDSKL